LALLADFGVPTVPTRSAGNEEEAMAAFHDLSGGPVVLKTAAGSTHKSDVDGVRLGLRTGEELIRAYREMAARLGDQVLIQAMVPSGVEVGLGIVNDSQFGPLVMVGAGGRLIELLADRIMLMPPIDAASAARALDRIKVGRLLDGYRNQPPADLGAVVDVIVKLGVLATELGTHLQGLDLNPLIAGPAGAVAVDALIVNP
jgi:acyl-CoA synthetase (NDP forming)